MTPSSLIRRRFGLSESEFASFIQTCPYRYKTYPIAKRNSDKKRMISQPSRELKAVQRYILDKFLDERLKVHDAATAYRRGLSITHNAQPHLKNAYLLKMDFSDFFPSIKAVDFEKYLLDFELVEKDEAKVLALLFFKANDLGSLCLSIGSPGSPLISNALLYDFDKEVSGLCSGAKIAYTRYSDDITFSTNEKNLLFSWPEKVREVLREQSHPSLSINEDKTVFSSKKHNRHVTGITVTNDERMSVGRRRKRELRSRVYKADELNSEEIAELRGHIAFANQVEPGFIDRLKAKYPHQMRGPLKFADEGKG